MDSEIYAAKYIAFLGLLIVSALAFFFVLVLIFNKGCGSPAFFCARQDSRALCLLIATTKVVAIKTIAMQNTMYFAAYISEILFSENELHM